MRPIPILVICFNRPDPLRLLLRVLLECQVGPIWFACDGPRSAFDQTAVNKVRRMIYETDWRVEVKLRFRKSNLGCRLGVIDAIDWVLSSHDCAIILEDDIIPDPSFFPYTESILDYYSNDSRVMMVSGLNELGTWRANEASYFFTMGGIWGWATWARAWEKFDRNFQLLDSHAGNSKVEALLARRPSYVNHVLTGYQSAKAGLVDTWDYQWSVTRMVYGGLSVTPNTNLIANVGNGPDATHTRSSVPLTPRVKAMTFPIVHPLGVFPEWSYMREVDKSRSKNWLKNTIKKTLFKFHLMS